MSKTIDLPTDTQQRDKLVVEIEKRVEADAETRAYDAGMGGEWGDRGAGALRNAFRIWKDGLAGRVPPELAAYATEVLKENHPDYPAYLRLKADLERLGGKIGISD